MGPDRVHSRLFGCIAVWLLAVSPLAAQSTKKTALTPAELRGKHIYTRGESSSGKPISAMLAGGTEVSASLMPCRNCHGMDGRGKPEGGVTPTSVRWTDLTGAYQVSSSTGRRHGAYNESTLNRAIGLGIDPAGNKLDAAMPRFRMDHADFDDLIAWLKRIDKTTVDGLGADTIIIGTLLPPGVPGEAVRAVLAAYFERINAGGGIYARRIQFRPCALPVNRSDWLGEISKYLDGSQPFALVSSYSAGIEAELGELLSERELPLVGEYTLFPKVPDQRTSTTFYLDSGLRGEAEALARYIVDANPRKARVSLIVSPEQAYRSVADDAKSILVSSGWAVDEIAAGGALSHAARMILLLSPGATVPVDGEFQLFVPGTLVTEALLTSSAARRGGLFLAYSVLPSDYERAALADYDRLAIAARLPAAHRVLQFSALASAHILVEGLVRIGREASQDKLIEALEGFYDFRTGFTPPVTFGPNRRIGIQRARVVQVDPASGEFKLTPNFTALR